MHRYGSTWESRPHIPLSLPSSFSLPCWVGQCLLPDGYRLQTVWCDSSALSGGLLPSLGTVSGLPEDLGLFLPVSLRLSQHWRRP